MLKKLYLSETAAVSADTKSSNKQAVFKNCAPFNGYIGKIKTTQIDIDVKMPMYNLIEYSGNYLETSGG